MKEIIVAYRELQQNMGRMIDKSGYKNDFIAQRIGMKPGNFYVKKRRASWSDEEMMKILNILENDEMENYLLGQIMKEADKENLGEMNELMAVLNAE